VTADALYRNGLQVARKKKAERGRARIFSWLIRRERAVDESAVLLKML
jgi:hypothetical protein